MKFEHDGTYIFYQLTSRVFNIWKKWKDYISACAVRLSSLLCLVCCQYWPSYLWSNSAIISRFLKSKKRQRYTIWFSILSNFFIKKIITNILVHFYLFGNWEASKTKIKTKIRHCVLTLSLTRVNYQKLFQIIIPVQFQCISHFRT